jgi:putative DNA primase/helicase
MGGMEGAAPEGREGGENSNLPQTGVFARTNAPGLWGRFEEALHACEWGRWGYAGIGFLFTCKDPYVGIDMDHCRDPKTGSMEPWAQEIIDEARSYTENSPSGTGLHIIVKMKEKPPGLNKRKFGDIEIFVASVYLTFTGDHLPGTPKDIAYRDGFVKNLIAAHSKAAPKTTTRSKASSHSDP